MQKCTQAGWDEVERKWVLIDLEGKVLGRAATRIANILRGKHKTLYTPHSNTGDFVICINASKVRVTGNKRQDKKHYSHSGYPGGIKEINFEHLIAKDPAEVIRRAVHGMLPKNKQNKQLLKKLHVYPGAEHPHAAQKPQTESLP